MKNPVKDKRLSYQLRLRIVRGGGWGNGSKFVRGMNGLSVNNDPTWLDTDLGFRIVRNAS